MIIDDEFILQLINEYNLQKVWEMTNKKFVDYHRSSPYHKTLENRTFKVFVEGVGDVELKTGNYFRKSKSQVNKDIQKNISDFSKSKVFYTQKRLKELGKEVKSLDELREKSSSLLKKYYDEFTKTELEMMLDKIDRAKQMADWFSDDSVDLIKFVTRRDEKVRHSHKQLEGITLPKTDKFWRRYSPPLEWNCRCVLQKVGREEGYEIKRPKQKDLEITESQVHKEIRNSTFHLLQEGSIRSLIDNQHPYFVEYLKFFK